MSRTKHHGKDQHVGEDFGGRHKCNKSYQNSYGKDGRKRLHSELRQDDKKAIKEGIESE